MERPMILVSSITYALKGRDLLLSYRISSFVERIPHLSKETGCGYALYVPKETDEAERFSGVRKGRVQYDLS